MIYYLFKGGGSSLLHSVRHGYTLEGKLLRACFGTTKYCHAWLRNVPCTDCLYLHEIGTREDSFTKDEIISAYTRSRVQKITGATIDVQSCSGNILPPPADEFSNNSCSLSAVEPNKSSTNDLDIGSENILESSVWQTPASCVRGFPPNSSTNKSVTPPPAAAPWGVRASNSHTSITSMASANGSYKEKPDTCSISVSFLTAVASPAKVSMAQKSGKILNGEV